MSGIWLFAVMSTTWLFLLVWGVDCHKTLPAFCMVFKHSGFLGYDLICCDPSYVPFLNIGQWLAFDFLFIWDFHEVLLFFSFICFFLSDLISIFIFFCELWFCVLGSFICSLPEWCKNTLLMHYEGGRGVDWNKLLQWYMMCQLLN